ncbi:TetR/AcrR family transcriptional regulator [Clostridium oryzae]|uniref:Nucleoid occlusion factor SlmA n=1 Tax=Clostridium oryzae TaxID=1450648 RepID=A0A1V4IXI4_9CLOT|nr:TetR/AcrR family transcriptional regulator [Clostridium oryzae]OPJ64619.1 nucleoid occlusion factor SlmA [Clostridium oryzae]
MARGFTEQEKQNIRSKMLAECEKSWAKYGYKKTSVDGICAQVGISKGAFYLFFESKEALFSETLCMVQDRIYTLVEKIMEKQPNKQGFAQALKASYREYNKNLLICDMQSADFLALANKLSTEQLSAIEKNSRHSGELLFSKPYLKFLIDKNKAASILMSLLSIVSVKDRLSYDHFEVFDFMIDNLIDKIFE